MAIQFQSAPGSGGSGDLVSAYVTFMEDLGVPQEAILTVILVALFLFAVFFFRAGDVGSGRR